MKKAEVNTLRIDHYLDLLNNEDEINESIKKVDFYIAQSFLDITFNGYLKFLKRKKSGFDKIIIDVFCQGKFIEKYLFTKTISNSYKKINENIFMWNRIVTYTDKNVFNRN